jgi:hypothetical protein
LGAIISPYGTPFTGETANATMTITILDLAILKEGPKIAEEMKRSANLTSSGPLPAQSNVECKTEKSYLDLNGMIVMHAFSECKDPADKTNYSVSNIYNAATEENLISVGLSSNSAQSYDKFVSEFEQSIKTLKIRNTIDHRTIWDEPLSLKTEIHTVEAKGNAIDVEIQSNSEISDFVFDEEQKRLSFKVQGEDETSGFTVIPISRVLDGPYTLTIDGNVTEDFQVVDDHVSGDIVLEIGYRHSAHDIVITGTNVVPEFTLHLILIFAFIFGIIAAIGRMKLI